MLLKMTRVQIIGTLPHLDATIRLLHRIGVLHIERVSESTALKNIQLDSIHLRMRESLDFLLARLNAIIAALPERAEAARPEAAGSEGTKAESASVDEINANILEIEAKVRKLAAVREEIETEARSLPRYEATLRKLAPLAAELHELSGYETSAILIYKRFRDALGMVRVEIERLTGGRFEIISRDVDESTIAALLIYPRSLAREVQAVLGQENITQVRLPKELAGATFRDALVALELRQRAIEEQKGEIDRELESISGQHRHELVAWRDQVRSNLDELTVRGQFGAMKYTFMIQGWVPKSNLGELRAAVARDIGNEVLVVESEVDASERSKAPVVFSNPAPLKPFESLVRLVGAPHYGGLDPTPLMAVFLPMFFGIILGDIGYGAITLVLAVYLRRRFRQKKMIADLTQIVVYGSVWAIVFGILFGEFFGGLGARFGLHPLWMPREGEYIVALFVFSLALGTVQVVLGLVLGMWGAWRERQHRELAAKLGLLLSLGAIFGMLAAAADFLPRHFFTPSVVLLLIGMVLLIVPTGLMGAILGPLEVLETVGNILSYLRIAAIGLSSVYLAMVANKMAGVIGNLIVGVIVALLLHGLNVALGVLSPTIQSLRLHYVEFFRQFHHGGGESYRPFKIEKS